MDDARDHCCISIVANFAIVIVGMPRLIEKLKETGTITIDRYKKDSREIPT